ncbi:type II toxin-antitoxin system RelE/ParE family toxin [Desulfovibrio sp. JY]|nr:type II toxin-antitoxin system RelE/ParE family toxin [Desulfovibrio sp. JY]
MPVMTILEAQGRAVLYWFEKAPDEIKGPLLRCPGIKEQERTLAIRFIKHFLTLGEFPRNEGKFKHYGDEGYYAIKAGKQLRLPGIYLDKDKTIFVVVNCFRKKRDRWPKSEVKRAQRLVELCVKELV